MCWMRLPEESRLGTSLLMKRNCAETCALSWDRVCDMVVMLLTSVQMKKEVPSLMKVLQSKALSQPQWVCRL